MTFIWSRKVKHISADQIKTVLRFWFNATQCSAQMASTKSKFYDVSWRDCYGALRKDPCINVYAFHRRKKVISQLRSGYTLNEYRHKAGLQDSPYCSCGGIETVAHYICDCEEYEVERQKLITQLFYQTGEQVISTEIFLCLKDEVFKEHREALLMIMMLSDYITSTKWFLRK